MIFIFGVLTILLVHTFLKFISKWLLLVEILFSSIHRKKSCYACAFSLSVINFVHNKYGLGKTFTGLRTNGMNRHYKQTQQCMSLGWKQRKPGFCILNIFQAFSWSRCYSIDAHYNLIAFALCVPFIVNLTHTTLEHFINLCIVFQDLLKISLPIIDQSSQSQWCSECFTVQENWGSSNIGRGFLLHKYWTLDTFFFL